MASSLQDQLLKAGLADKNKAKTIHKNKSKKKKAARKTKQPVVDQAKVKIDKRSAERIERDRELNKAQQLRIQKKAITAQIIQLIDLNKLDRKDGAIAYSFVHAKKIKKIHITTEIQTKLSSGLLSIAGYEKGNHIHYEIVPNAVAKKIAERDSECIIAITKDDDAPIQDDDPYADYQIPDDLMW